MKVRCIKEYGSGWLTTSKKNFWGNTKKRYMKGPKKGDVLTVEHEYWSEGEKWYCLIEWPHQESGAYAARHFKTLEEKYETVKLEEIKEKASAN